MARIWRGRSRSWGFVGSHSTGANQPSGVGLGYQVVPRGVLIIELAALGCDAVSTVSHLEVRGKTSLMCLLLMCGGPGEREQA